LICLAVTAIPASAQSLWTVFGQVHDDGQEPLVGASVFIDGTFAGATDSSGRYYIAQQKMPASITVRHLGYFQQKSTLTVQDFQHQKAQIDFTLVNQSNALRELTITTKAIETIVQEDFSVDLFDFGFAGPNLLLLLREKKHFLLRLIRENGEVLSQLRLPEECHLLHQSCLGDFHAVGSTSAWEIALKETVVDTLPRYAAAQFQQFIEPCVQHQADQYYLIQRGLLNQSLQYLVFEKEQQPRVAFRIEDKKGMSMAREALGDFYRNNPMIFRTPYWAKQPLRTAEFEDLYPWWILGNLNTVEGLTSLSGYDDDQIYRVAELETIRRDSVYAPLLNINDTLCLFDHVNSCIVRFGPGLERSDVVSISYHFDKGWEKQILQDVQNKRVYGRFSNNKGLILKEIDAKTGRTGKTYQLAQVPHISDKFKIRNGLLYFIGQPDVNTPNKMLYKMNIFAGQIR